MPRVPRPRRSNNIRATIVDAPLMMMLLRKYNMRLLRVATMAVSTHKAHVIDTWEVA
jgi:hypothetical protein